MNTSGITSTDQHSIRRNTLTTPMTFSVDLGGTSTEIYAGKLNFLFLIREISVCNTTGSAVSMTITKGSSTWVNGVSIAANATQSIAGLSGVLFPDNEDLDGIGAGLTVFGWGLRIEGGDNWTL